MTDINNQCLNCGLKESVTPLLQMRHKGKTIWICPQCLPTLIHAPQKLTGKIEDAELIKPSKHKH